MIDIQIPASKEYNTENASLLGTALINLHSFNDIAEWDKKATAEIEVMRSILRTIEGKQQMAVQALVQENHEHEEKPFLARLFDGRKEKKRWLVEQSRLAGEKGQIENLIGQFETAIDFTPNSLDDLKELIKECKQKKKELQTEKKAVNAQMTAIRVNARQRRVNTFSGKLGTAQRREIRFDEESALGPQESQKAAFERQIIKLDQLIVWLERLK
jgi:chromosome segregation ATPase